MSADIEWTDTRDGDAPLVKLAAMLQALEMEPAAVNLSAQQLAVICRGITKVAKRAPPQPSVSCVPEKFPIREEVFSQYASGWNACRDEMLAAAPHFTETQHTTKKG